ncbi:RNA 2',3'-cyclic phosphodiesterase [Quadrisphaera sp. INWT6]|uniref:RNA 2',3'-cyclic phosphodiesterase n=1 Tax=Quadrisphaera sp. INWT6 TaxID=2596917 RepID=UPI00189266A8|nr:RNA 2',3'-cyclic phosphodiesterase [Quadrisphaera sp. INWT6]
MRLFVSLTPPLEAVQTVADAVTELGRVPGVRWSPPHRWHVTLAFLGEVDAVGVPPLARALAAAAAAHEPPRLRLAGTGCFGDRVLWAGVAGDLDRLSALAAAVAHAGRSAGAVGESAEPGEQAYRPHVTLARAAGRGAGGELPRLAEQLAAQLAHLSGPTWTAREVQLVQSHASDGRYEVLESFALGGGSP